MEKRRTLNSLVSPHGTLACVSGTVEALPLRYAEEGLAKSRPGLGSRSRTPNAKWNIARVPSQAGRVAVVTGANSGIGFATARALAGKGARVFLACRDESKVEASLRAIRKDVVGAQVEAVHLDLADLDSVDACARELKMRCGRLDLLVNNAGVMVPPLTRTKQGFELQFGTNHLGHFALTCHLFPLLSKTIGARVVVVSSAGGNLGRIQLDDLNYDRRPYQRWGAYCQSKLANLVFALELARRSVAAGSNVTVTAAHPGGASTNLQRTSWYLRWFVNPLVMSAEGGSMPSLRAALDPDAKSGSYWAPSGPFEMSGSPSTAYVPKRAKDRDLAQGLWKASEELTGVRFALRTNQGPT